MATPFTESLDRLTACFQAAFEHLELIPHRHAQNKEAIDLSDEMYCESFVSWLKENLPRTR